MKPKTLSELKHQICQKVIGQPELVEKILLTLQLHDIKTQADSHGLKTDIMSNLLIIGGTGTGKTMAVREAVKVFGYTLFEFNAKTFAQEGGWAGDSFSNQLNRVWNKGQTYAPVIFIDEFDKIIEANYESGGSDVNKSIQQGLLKFIEGAKTSVNFRDDGGYDLSNACFIFAGAFTELEKDSNLQTMGFFGTLKHEHKTLNTKLIEFGLLEELLGRINRIVITNEVDKGMLYNIAVNPHNMYNQYLNTLDTLGVNKPDYKLDIDTAIEKALKLNLGVRGLNQVFMEEIDKLVQRQFENRTIEDSLNAYHIRRLT